MVMPSPGRRELLRGKCLHDGTAGLDAKPEWCNVCGRFVLRLIGHLYFLPLEVVQKVIFDHEANQSNPASNLEFSRAEA
jgi:hypothetical protein